MIKVLCDRCGQAYRENTCDDVISRQAAIDAITHELMCGAVMDQCGLETAYDLIKELPPVTPQQKRPMTSA